MIKRYKWGGFAILFMALTACGDVGGAGQCGGGENTGICVRIESVTPKYKEKNTSSVDVVSGSCDDVATSTTIKGEVITDHSAELVVSNRPLPGVKVDDTSDVTLNKFTITYKVNRCPEGTICPSLTPLNAEQTHLIPKNGSKTFSLPFVSLSTKQEFVSRGGTSASSTSAFFPIPSYTGTYTLTGSDTNGKSVSVVGSAEFDPANYNTCSS